MSQALRIQCYLWSLLFLIFVLGTTAYQISSRITFVPLRLAPGSSLEIDVISLVPRPLNVSLSFHRQQGGLRPELGSHTARDDWRQTGQQVFDEPGDPIKLLIETNGTKVVYEARPASAFGAETIRRVMVPFVDDGDPRKFPWPPNPALIQALPRGITTLHVSVLAAGEKVRNEEVQLVIPPPVSFLYSTPGYEGIANFRWSLIYGCALIAWGIALSLRYRREHNSRMASTQ